MQVTALRCTVHVPRLSSFLDLQCLGCLQRYPHVNSYLRSMTFLDFLSQLLDAFSRTLPA
jgi:hypothetical protein